MIRNRCAHAVYLHGESTSFLLIGVYVDDLIRMGNSDAEIQEFKGKMSRLFKMSDLGLLSYYLGIVVLQKNSEIMISQKSYATKVLERAGMGSCNSCHMLMENRLKLCRHNGSGAVNATEYRSIIGCLRYLVNTRPDLAHSVSIASRFMEEPSVLNWAALKQILLYIGGTLGHGCCYKTGNGELKLTGFNDSNLDGDIDDRRSTSGVVFFFDDSPITWTSQKQKMVHCLLVR
jgi:hypothetical protein